MFEMKNMFCSYNNINSNDSVSWFIELAVCLPRTNMFIVDDRTDLKEHPLRYEIHRACVIVCKSLKQGMRLFGTFSCQRGADVHC